MGPRERTTTTVATRIAIKMESSLVLLVSGLVWVQRKTVAFRVKSDRLTPAAQCACKLIEILVRPTEEERL